MLRELSIRNFAIIEELDLVFEPGLTIFTGETGAGKSIILDALSAVLGGKVDDSLVRRGAERASVEAVFELDGELAEAIEALLEPEGLNEEQGSLVLSREIRAEGRSIARVNGRAAAASLQAELGALLVDLHGQSEHLSLLRERHHLELLDRYAHNEEALSAWRGAYQSYRALQAELKALRELQADAEARLDLLRFQVQEIEAAKLKEGEEEELRLEGKRLANAESLHSLSSEALNCLDEGQPDAPAASDLLGQASHALSQIAAIDPSLGGLAERVEASLAGLQDAGYELRQYLERIEFNPRRLDQIEERLELIKQLKRKYGGEIGRVIAHLEHNKAELDKVEHSEERINELDTALLDAEAGLITAGQVLSQRRKDAAQKLAAAIETQLEALSMRKARFMAALGTESAANGLKVDGQELSFDANGWDKAAFMVETNPGEGYKPLVKVASGGETSRLMLALKQALAAADRIPTLVFDEIDQGIGGRVGMVVGEMLWRLAQRHQVMCVTHLPQMAAFADQHYKVSKALHGERTTTELRNLTDEERLQELAAMSGPLGAGTLHSATEIATIVKEIKGKISA